MAAVRKATLNFLLEGITLVALVGQIATGFAMKFTLPPRSGERLTQWGLNRHQWGAVHFWFAMAFIIFLVLHLVLHWRWIWAIAQGTDPATRKARGPAFLLVTAGLIAVCALPWLVPVRAARVGFGEGGGVRAGQPQAVSSGRPDPGAERAGAAGEDGQAIKGYMTLGEVAQATGLSLEEVGKALNYSGQLTGQERIGQFARQQGLPLNDARRRIEAAAHEKVGKNF